MKKYTIGLDLGINNVGWAKYDLETKKVIDKGVVRFKESSTAQDVECEDCSRLSLSLHSKKSDVEHILIGDYKASNSCRIYQDLL